MTDKDKTNENEIRDKYDMPYATDFITIRKIMYAYLSENLDKLVNRQLSIEEAKVELLRHSKGLMHPDLLQEITEIIKKVRKLQYGD